MHQEGFFCSCGCMSRSYKARGLISFNTAVIAEALMVLLDLFHLVTTHSKEFYMGNIVKPSSLACDKACDRDLLTSGSHGGSSQREIFLVRQDYRIRKGSLCILYPYFLRLANELQFSVKQKPALPI